MSVALRVENDVGFIEFDQESSRVNLLTSETMRELDHVLDEILGHKDLNVVVLVSKKKDIFIAGADIKEIERFTQAREGEEKSRAGQAVLDKLEDLKVPTIAVIDGVALGGGCELALACNYRLATFNEKIKIGLPEVNLGFVPGFGGTYRLPRLVGLAEALKLILSAKPVSADKALKIGLVDQLVPREGLTKHLYAFIARIFEGKTVADKYRRRRKKGLARLAEGSWVLEWVIFRQSRKSVLHLTKGFYPAPLRALDLIEKTYHAPRARGMIFEARAFGELAVTDISKNLVQVFYLSEQCKKLTVEGAEQLSPLPIGKCGVLGAGVMGGGIAQLLSYKKIWVRLKDVHYDAVGLGLKAAAKIYAKAVKSRKMSVAEAEKGMARITGTLDYSGFQNADLVIEAVIEKIEVKKKVFRELSESVAARAVLATNTSALSVSEMAKETKDPSKVLGFHFFNPVDRMPLVEVIVTPFTSKESIVTALEFAKRLGKMPILVKDSCGFIVNRILLGYINEAGRILEECGRMEEIERLVMGFGMPMGPFSLSDEVGLDVGIKVLHVLEEGFGPRFKPTDSFEKILARGLLGKKSGKGFYIHGKERKSNPEIVGLLGQRVFKGFQRDDYLKRMVYIMVNEAARCLEDGIVDDPSVIDAGMIFGAGFPAFRGGLMRYADTVGIASVVADLERLDQQAGDGRFKPCGYLSRLRDEKRSFYPSLSEGKDAA